ncbi:hypothetical protein HDU97_000234 [Phlyctochytrium planicorne]|nr:hypothetical protein HDU97_000234 [Phlyctochytrium planicorne]
MEDDFDFDFGDDIEPEILEAIAAAEQRFQNAGASASSSDVYNHQQRPSAAPVRQATLFEMKKSTLSAPLQALHKPHVGAAAFKDDFDHFRKDAPVGYCHHDHKVDTEAAKTWVYPVSANKPIRDYQLYIAEKCLYMNTLVSLPTGLGKTFIASVVIYNYFRWFPEGKIVFMAPTKPLVTQQIEACRGITGIPLTVMDEMTGKVDPQSRRLSWAAKRVFFLTPQVLQNDLKSEACNAEKVVLVVIDEAHRATGDHAYCEVVRLIRQKSTAFRIMALSATPGSAAAAVQSVVQNLHISRIEMRTEESPDIIPHTFKRVTESIVVKPHDDMKMIADVIARIASVYTEKFVEETEKHSTALRYELIRSKEFTQLLSNIKSLQLKPDFISHPKLERLIQIVLQHFADSEEENSTRVMIFAEIRDSVGEIVEILSKHHPLVKAAAFVGQGSGKNGMKRQSQKEQFQVLERFHSGQINTLVATCIGEEGLDIGDVDLIINYDSQNSPIRLLQRMGRTGRKRQGKVVVLLSEGKEEESYKKSQAQYKAIQKSIATDKIIVYGEDMPNMLPKGAKPTLVKTELEIQREPPQQKASKTKATAERKSKDQSSNGPLLNDRELEEYKRKYLLITRPRLGEVSLSRYIHWQAVESQTHHVRHSDVCKNLIQLLNLFNAIGDDEEKQRPNLYSQRLIDKDLEFSARAAIDSAFKERANSKGKKPSKASRALIIDDTPTSSPSRDESSSKRRRTLKDLTDLKMDHVDNDLEDVNDILFAVSPRVNGSDTKGKGKRKSLSNNASPRRSYGFLNADRDTSWKPALMDDDFVFPLDDARQNDSDHDIPADHQYIDGMDEDHRTDMDDGVGFSFSPEPQYDQQREHFEIPMSPDTTIAFEANEPEYIPESPSADAEIPIDVDYHPQAVVNVKSHWTAKNRELRDDILRVWPPFDVFLKKPDNSAPELISSLRNEVEMASDLLDAASNSHIISQTNTGSAIKTEAGLCTKNDEVVRQTIGKSEPDFPMQDTFAVIEASIVKPSPNSFSKQYFASEFKSNVAAGAKTDNIQEQPSPAPQNTFAVPQSTRKATQQRSDFLSPKATTEQPHLEEDTPLITRRKMTKRRIFNSSSPAVQHLSGSRPQVIATTAEDQLKQLFDHSSSPQKKQGDEELEQDEMGEDDEDEMDETGEPTPEFARILRKRREPKKRKAPRPRTLDLEPDIVRREDVRKPAKVPKLRTHRKVNFEANPFIEHEAALSEEDNDDSGDEIIDGDIDCDLQDFVVQDGEISMASTPATGLLKAAGSSPEISMYQRSLLNNLNQLSAKRRMPPPRRYYRRDDWQGQATQWGAGAEATEYYDDEELADFVVDDDHVEYSTQYQPSALNSDEPDGTEADVSKDDAPAPGDAGIDPADKDAYNMLLEGIEWSDGDGNSSPFQGKPAGEHLADPIEPSKTPSGHLSRCVMPSRSNHPPVVSSRDMLTAGNGSWQKPGPPAGGSAVLQPSASSNIPRVGIKPWKK